MDKSPLIELNNINVSYGKKQVLHDINLKIYPFDFLGIIGPNGGGKTTLIKTILGLKKPQSGEIKFFHNAEPVSSVSIGYLPQYNAIDKKFPITVNEVIMSGIKKKIFERYTEKDFQATKSIISRMGLEGKENNPIGELSGGQIQRALLGRAIISRPDVVILDEPNTYIDKRFELQLYALLGEINKESAIILVSHDIGSVLQNVRSIACVNESLDYHPDTELPEGWIEERFNCPIDLIGHGNIPHRVLKYHKHS